MASPRKGGGGKVDLDRDPKSIGFLLHRLHVKSESDWAKTVVCIVSTRSYTQSAKVDFYLWLRDPKSIGFLLTSSTTYMWSLEVIRQKTSLYPAHKVLFTKCQSWPWPLTPVTQINSVPPLVFHNLHVKPGSDWAKTIVCIVSTMYYTQCQSWPWSMTQWPKINRVPPLIIHNLHVKSESDWAKTIVCIVSKRSYTKSAKDDLDLWPHDLKSIGFLLSSSTTYMWTLKVIGLNLYSVSCPQGLIHRVPKLTLTFYSVT